MATKTDLETENADLKALLATAREVAKSVSIEMSKLRTEKLNLTYQKDCAAADRDYFSKRYDEALKLDQTNREEAKKVLNNTIQEAARLNAQIVQSLEKQYQLELTAERARCDTMAEVFDRTLQTLAKR